MKAICTLLFFFTFSLYALGQQSFYVVTAGSSNGGELLKINTNICDTTFIGNNYLYGSIAMASDSRLYGTSSGGLYLIDTSNASATLISPLTGLITTNNLVGDSSGHLLTVGNDSLYQINKTTGQYTALGYVGYHSAGDLTFYHDTLYLAGTDTCSCTQLIKIILHPTVSAQVVGTMNSPLAIWGINTICFNNVETMIASAGRVAHPFFSSIYKVNPNDASLKLLCDSVVRTIINDAASIYDINGMEIGCSVISQVNSTSSKDIISVFPNPATRLLTITTTSSQRSQIILYDIASRRLMQQQFTGTATLDVENLAKGIYIYEIKDENGAVQQGKVVKE